MKGLVWIVGAGPGDPDLITVKGLRLLSEAHLVVYAGSLINRELLHRCPEGCEVLDSSKMTLAEQVRVMADRALKGLNVVRLHTGDPSLYGAIGEQIRELKALGVECRIVPGVSSLQGAAAALGIEYTVPGGTQTLVCTRLPGRTPVPSKEDLRVYASTGATLALFLSSDMGDEISRLCMEGGLPGDTPAAWVYRATWPDQRVGTAKLRELGQRMKAEHVNRQALIIVGRCVEESGTSLLYDPRFSHMYRKAHDEGPEGGMG
ncbi:precorrin-4 C(11)-methyltransferase [Thermanaerovibrio velox]|uniref:precorrin-4 C(11)-methyltransferase n=1 Tax=Thermanaerovibrio velox TaxID=108007 RepID=UPI000301DEAA|nr:precorrin-4 C(11)-methyltransferase [Thermanaerovibrio velox]